MKKVISIFVFISISIFSFGQLKFEPLDSIKMIVKTLCSKDYSGRGYINNGMNKAANYLSLYFDKIQATPIFTDKYKQNFSINVNQINTNPKVFLDNKKLKEGEDYIISPKSNSINSTFRINKIKVNTTSPLIAKNINNKSLVYLDTSSHLLWSEAREIENNYSKIIMKPKIWEEALKSKKIKIDFKNITTNNNIANVGAKLIGESDTAIFFTAHYDHLGMMGKAIFPGASDNASGTAMILTLANYFSKIKSRHYTYYFILFAAEETGLLGSEYFTKNFKLDKDKIKMVVNIDIMGNASQGITVVNTVEQKDFLLNLRNINDNEKIDLPEIRERGNTKNSDHYHFTELGIPAVFIYSNGGQGYYHDIEDTAENLHYTNVEKVFELLKSWALNY